MVLLINNFFYAATFCFIFLAFKSLCFLHVFCKILGAIFEKWTFLFFQKCPKSKTANESRSTFFRGSLLNHRKYNYFICHYMFIELLYHVYQYTLPSLHSSIPVHCFFLHRLGTYFRVIPSLFEMNGYIHCYPEQWIPDAIYSIH